MRALWARLKAFTQDRRGNVAVIFAVSLVPLCLAIGASLDYARATMVRAAMNEALDVAALAVGGKKNISQSDANTLAQQYFNANYKIDPSYGTPAAVSVSISSSSVTVTTSDVMPTTMLKIVGVSSLPVSASSTVAWAGTAKLWVSLVLDNTGSMADTDSTGLSKMAALKTAAHQLLDTLKASASNPGDVQVSIIPFARDVNIGTGYSNASWLSFSDFDAAPPTPSNSIGPGGGCPWQDYDEGYHCTSGPSNGASDTNAIPYWGSYSGYICPSLTVTGHYWNGCFDSSGWWGYTHTWKANPHSTWTGCVTDRGGSAKPNGQAVDVRNTTPTISDPTSLFVAENTPSCPTATILPLGYDWNALSSKVDSMQPNGSTNQTIGMVWGWQSMTQGAPLNPPVMPTGTQRVMILLSDGLNTQNRWSGNGYDVSSDVDGRLALACSNAKADGIIIYTLFVNINGGSGSSAPLQGCASDKSKYFTLTTSSQIISAFATIVGQIGALRVTQ
ncbi:hypothetical protein GCM10008941_32630 [Rhizomicrobium palustre]